MLFANRFHASAVQPLHLVTISWNQDHMTYTAKHWCGLSSMRWCDNTSGLYNRAIGIDRESSLLFPIQVSTRRLDPEVPVQSRRTTPRPSRVYCYHGASSRSIGLSWNIAQHFISRRPEASSCPGACGVCSQGIADELC